MLKIRWEAFCPVPQAAHAMANKEIFDKQKILNSETILKKGLGQKRAVLCYPNTYAVGMSNLGFQAIFGLFNTLDDVACERVFLDTNGRSLESGTPLCDFDIVLFSISFELDYPSIVSMLSAGGVNPYSRERNENAPIVMAGGAVCYYNPLPVAPFFDIILSGDGEKDFADYANTLFLPKHEAMDTLEGKEGIFIPALHLTSDMTFKDFLKCKRRIAENLDQTPIKSEIYTENTEFGSMGLVEISRGCNNRCLFCVASHSYAPYRMRSFAGLKEQFLEVLEHRKRIGLVGAAVTDHPEILSICEYILEQGGEISPASMSAKALNIDLLTLLKAGGVRSITLAPECGSEKLRKRVGKGSTKDEILFSAVENAVRVGINNLKLYFMIGVPDEEDDDVAAIARLSLAIKKEFKVNVSIGVSSLIPKPSTPFADVQFTPINELNRRLAIIRKGLKGQVNIAAESTRWSYFQALFACGDSSVADGIFKVGTDSLNQYNDWKRAFNNDN